MSLLADLDSIGHHCRCHLRTLMMYLLAVCLFSLHVGGSAESGQRLTSCRQIYKAKPPPNITASWTDTHTFPPGVSCLAQVTLQNTDEVMVNIADPRNCQNFYECKGLTCRQCPCPSGLTFNPITLHCDDTNAVCRCNTPTTSMKSSTLVTEIPTPRNDPGKSTQEEKVITPAGIPAAQGTTPPPDSTSGVVIIAVIVIATVIILVALIIGFCLWQRGVFPLTKKPSMHPSSNDGYLHTLPPQERHVYAEIDERTVNRELHHRNSSISEEEARRHLQHIYAPPIPSNPPPTTCALHPHQTFVLPPGHQQRLYPQFSGYPLQSQPTDGRDLMRFTVSNGDGKNNFSQNNNLGSPIGGPGGGGGDLGDNSSMTSCSGCSHCSGLSNQTHLEHHEAVDRRTLLRNSNNTPPLAQFNNFVSKQVYI